LGLGDTIEGIIKLVLREVCCSPDFLGFASSFLTTFDKKLLRGNIRFQLHYIVFECLT